MSAQISAGAMNFGATRGGRNTSAAARARTAGVLYLVAVLTAIFAEFIAPGKLGAVVAIVVPIACYAGVTLLLFSIFMPVNRDVAVLTGFLMFKSGFLPRVLGVLMAIAGLVWLIYLSPSLAKSFSPGIQR